MLCEFTYSVSQEKEIKSNNNNFEMKLLVKIAIYMNECKNSTLGMLLLWNNP